MPPHDDALHRLLVEGFDELCALAVLMEENGADASGNDPLFPYIVDSRGRSNLVKAIGTTLKAPYRRVGFVFDADDSPNARWEEIRTECQAAGLNVPATPVHGGFWSPGLRPGSRFGLWMMPDNRSTGALEDWLTTLINPDDRCWPIARQAVADAHGQGCALEARRTKADIRTWLAWQRFAGAPYGTALRRGYLRAGAPEAQPFVSWFRALFLEP